MPMAMQHYIFDNRSWEDTEHETVTKIYSAPEGHWVINGQYKNEFGGAVYGYASEDAKSWIMEFGKPSGNEEVRNHITIATYYPSKLTRLWRWVTSKFESV